MIFVFIDKSTEKLYLTNVEISQEDKKTFDTVLKNTDLSTRFTFLEETTWYGGPLNYKLESLYFYKYIVIKPFSGSVYIADKYYCVDPYAEIFDIDRQIHLDYGISYYSNNCKKSLYKYNFTEMYSMNYEEEPDIVLTMKLGM